MSTFYDQVLKANIYIEPMLFTAIVITNTIKICVLSSPVFRTSPFTYYFIAYAICGTIHTIIICPTQVIRGLLIGWENTPVGCKIYFCVLTPLVYLARIMLVFAAFDRYCASSKSRRLNVTSTKRKAVKVIIVILILMAVYMVPTPILYSFDATIGLCRQSTSLSSIIYFTSQLILHYTLEPLLIAIFGILTIVNIHRNALRIEPQQHQRNSRRTERQLARMLLFQLCAHLICQTPFGVIYFLNSYNASSRVPFVFGIRYVFFFLLQCEYIITFFLYIASGSLYRQQLRLLLTFPKQQARVVQVIQLHQIESNQRRRIVDA